MIALMVRRTHDYRKNFASWLLLAGLGAAMLLPADARAQDDALQLDDDVLEATDNFLREIVGAEASEVPWPDPAQTDEYLRELQSRLEGEYVLDLAPWKRVVDFLLPLLEAHEPLKDLGAWLQSRRDYFEVLDELILLVPAPSATNSPAITITNAVHSRAGTNVALKSLESAENPPLRPAAGGDPARPGLSNDVSVEIVPAKEDEPVPVQVVIVPPGATSGRSAPPKSPPSPTRPPATKSVVRANPRPDAVRAAWSRRMSSRKLPPGAAVWVPRLKPVFIAAGVPAELVWLAEVESGFNPRARSPAGAVGLYQLMPVTARSLGLSTFPFDQRKSAEPSARAAARYLRQLYGQFEDWPLALAAYNAGPARVRNVLTSRQGSSFREIASHLPAETQLYVPKFDALLQRREGRLLHELPATAGLPNAPK